ncbi:MAG: type II toxin-antitoxin system RelE/ParE family toxin [Deltaproteobacteria bacterium]|nr:type II toxin-antitoxin system RelE/ParE family toxin [Deltaproteobacteria bacterium]
MSLKITYYETSRGDWPVKNYIEALPEKERAKVKALVDYLSERVVLNEPHARKISGYSGLYELRPGSHRIFYCYDQGIIVLLHAFRKKSDKTPIREIETAFSRMRS